MNEEELFCKLFPEYAVNGKPLSPYFDLFESGYEQAENRFAELQERIKTLEYRCENIKDTDTMELVALQKENADLKEEINKIAFARGNLEEENAELKAENQKWKDEWQEQVQKATDEGYARTLQTIQLTKAKEIIKEVMNWYWETDICSDTMPQELRQKAEQFLSEVEK